MAKKLCPLTYITEKGAYDQDVSGFDNCTEKACAWWDDFTGHCAILSISRHGGEGSFNVVKRERKADSGG